MTTTEESDDYEANIQKILKDLVFHTLKNKPKNIVRNLYFIIILAEIYGKIFK